MGYNTDFKGTLFFKEELTRAQIVEIKKFFGEDCRDHSEWSANYKNLLYINLEFNEDMTGIIYDGNEKAYYMVEHVNLIIENMRKIWPEFALTGTFLCQGEDVEDRWELVFNDKGLAERRDVKTIGETVRCPHCEKSFKIASYT